jgi:hypothetical protein
MISSWLASAGVFFLDFFYGGIVSCLLAETTLGANVGGFRKSDGGPEHKIPERAQEST